MTHAFEHEPTLEMMRDLVTRYDSLGSKESRTAFLAEQGVTYGILQTYRKLIAIIDDRMASLPISSGASRTRRRRTKRVLVAPPGRPGTRRRPIRNRRDRRVTVVITLSIDIELP
ncbi:hypothetical protein GCM10018785_52300 [Streptomyces longispororuber]|uniref:Uncharacterized protein n=1 Tax=Streptomyces longispororuber TaxID=68230 RepID=A0A919DTS4_9ACTN|nr:hypothetical protein [Streptomyces longispororuber]GHE77569.1 hypothetical protein GCM10018785_52300 [Streptomyces longispororuber]